MLDRPHRRAQPDGAVEAPREPGRDVKSDAMPAIDAAASRSALTPCVRLIRDAKAARAAGGPSHADATSATDALGGQVAASAATSLAQRVTSASVVGSPSRGSRT